MIRARQPICRGSMVSFPSFSIFSCSLSHSLTLSFVIYLLHSLFVQSIWFCCNIGPVCSCVMRWIIRHASTIDPFQNLRFCFFGFLLCPKIGIKYTTYNIDKDVNSNNNSFEQRAHITNTRIIIRRKYTQSKITTIKMKQWNAHESNLFFSHSIDVDEMVETVKKQCYTQQKQRRRRRRRRKTCTHIYTS